MGDIAGFVTALLSLWLGAGRSIGELRTITRQRARIEFVRLRVGLVPILAAFAQRALIVTLVILGLVSVLAIGLSNESARDFIADHRPFIVSLAISTLVLAVLWAYQGDARAAYLTDAHGHPLRYPEQTAAGAAHPLAGLRQIDQARHRPDASLPSTTFFSICLALVINGGWIMAIAYREKNLAMFAIGTIPILLAIIFFAGVGYWTVRAIMTIGQIGAWSLRTALSQFLVLLLNITRENVHEHTDPIRIPENRYADRLLEMCEDGIAAFVLYATVVGSFFRDGITAVFTPALVVAVYATIRNNRVNPNLGVERRKWLAKHKLVILVSAVLLGALFRYTEIGSALELYWGFLLGRYCLPVSDGGWLHLLFSLAVIGGILYALGKWAQWKDWTAKWKIVSGVVMGILILSFPLKYAMAIGARISDEAEVCMAGSGLKPMKAEAEASESSTNTTRWWPASAAETPRAPAAPRYHEASRARHRYSDGNLSSLDPSFREKVEKMRANGEL